MNRGEIKTEILVRSGKDTTSAWTSEAFLNDWINQSHRWAAGYKPWPFTEGRTSTTYTSTEEWSFEGYKADSFRLVQVGGSRLKKLNFNDYQLFKEENPTGNDRVFSDFGQLMFINPNLDLSGTLTAWGQFMPAYIPDGDGATADDLDTVFSPMGDEGNEAIISDVLAKLANRDGKRDDALVHKKNAIDALLSLWKRIEDEQAMYQTSDERGGMFDRINVLWGRTTSDERKENQF